MARTARKCHPLLVPLQKVLDRPATSGSRIIEHPTHPEEATHAAVAACCCRRFIVYGSVYSDALPASRLSRVEYG